MIRLIFLLFVLSSGDAIDQIIRINLVPRDYVEACDQEGFICGVDKTVDSERLLSEQSVEFILGFIDKTADNSPRYRTSVVDVSAPNAAGKPIRLIEESLDGESGLVCLFLAPHRSPCNRLTFEDAREEKEGFYPVFIGHLMNVSAQIGKYEADSENLKALYNGKIPKLCATLTLMKEKTSMARAETLLQMFNFVYNEDSSRNVLSLAPQCCKTKTNTNEAISQSGFFDTNSMSLSFDSSTYTVSESDGFVEATLSRQNTGKKEIVFIETEFSTGDPSQKAVDASDIVPYNYPVIFSKSSNMTPVVVRIKVDSDDQEGDEYFKIQIKTNKKRRKRDLSSYTVVVKVTDSLAQKNTGSLVTYLTENKMGSVGILHLCNMWYDFTFMIANLAKVTNGEENEFTIRMEDYDRVAECEHGLTSNWVKSEAVQTYTEYSDDFQVYVKEKNFELFFEKMKIIEKDGYTQGLTTCELSQTIWSKKSNYPASKWSQWCKTNGKIHNTKEKEQLKDLLEELLTNKERIFGYIQSAALQIWLLNNEGLRQTGEENAKLYRSKYFDADEFAKVAKLDIGSIIQMNQFTSTSTKPRKRTSRENIFFEFQQCEEHGASVMDLSVHSGEQEVLLPAGKCYSLTKLIQELYYRCVSCPEFSDQKSKTKPQAPDVTKTKTSSKSDGSKPKPKSAGPKIPQDKPAWNPKTKTP